MSTYDNMMQYGSPPSGKSHTLTYVMLGLFGVGLLVTFIIAIIALYYGYKDNKSITTIIGKAGAAGAAGAAY